MNKERLHDLAILNSLSTLDGDERREFEVLMEDADEAARSEVASWDATVANLGAVTGQLLAPPTSVKTKLMRKIQERHATERSLEGPGSPRLDHARGIYSMYPDRMEWSKHPVEGVYIKVLTESERRGYVTMLMKVEAGVVFPEHHHSGEEECYVLSGSIILNGKKIGPGVLHHGDEESEHATLTSDEGALLFLVVAKEDYIQPV